MTNFWFLFFLNYFTQLDLEVPQGWQSAISLDSLKSSHPVMQDVQKSSEIDELFDSISYNKVIDHIVSF